LPHASQFSFEKSYDKGRFKIGLRVWTSHGFLKWIARFAKLIARKDLINKIIGKQANKSIKDRENTL
jgi:hypothetical protein